MRLGLVLAVALLAGCTQPPRQPPPAAAADVQVGALAAFGSANWSFSTDVPVLLAAHHLFTLDEGNRTVRQASATYPPGPWLLRLEGFGDAAWAVMPASQARLRFSNTDGQASLYILGSESFLSLEQVPEPGAATVGPCSGTQHSDAGGNTTIGPRFWTTRAAPGLGTIELALTGPGPCAGLTLRLSHLGAWRVGAPS